DISGRSGLAILDAILAGERDPKKLASLADRRVEKSQAQIEAALTGDYRPELLFVLSQSLDNYRQMQQLIAQCDLGIEKQLAKIADCTAPSQDSDPTQQSQSSTPYKPRKRKRSDRNPRIKRYGRVESVKRNRDQYGKVAEREGLCLLA